MKFKAFIMAFSMLCALSYSQETVQGIITDANTGKVLVGATVSTVNGENGTVSSENGSFKLNVAATPVDIVVQHVGYKSQQLIIKSSDMVTVMLVAGEYLEEIVIKGVRADFNSPVSQSTLNRKEIKKVYKGEHPIYFLGSLTPSITTESEAGTSFGNYGTMRLRGMEQKRINFTLNGVPLNDMIDHGVFFSNFTDISNSFESVQVQRGVGTSSNGVASYAGSVNFESINLEKQRAGSELQFGYGSYNSSRINAQVNSGMINEKWAFHASFSKLHSDGYRDNSESDAYSFFFSGGYFGKNDVIKINAFDARSKNGLAYSAVPQATLDTTPTYNPLDENDRDDFGQQFFQLQHIHTFHSNLNIVSSVYYNGAGGDFPWGWRENGRLNQINYPLTNNHFGFMSNVHLGISENLNISGGVHAYSFFRNNLEQNVPDFKNPYYDEKSRKDEISAFVKGNYTLGNFTFFADVALRIASLTVMPDFTAIGIAEDDNLKTDWLFLSPKAGLSYSINNMLLYASLGLTSREPTKADILGGWSLTDSATYVALKSNIDFQHESVIDFELGYRINAEQYTVEANIFAMRFNDAILPTGETIEFGSQIRANIPESYRIGYELQFAYEPIRSLTISGNSSFIQSYLGDITFTGDSVATKDLKAPFSPEIIVNGNIAYKPLENIEVSVGGRYVSESFMTLRNEPEFTLPSYLIANARVTLNFLGKHSFTLEANNLLSNEYYTNGAALDVDWDGTPDVAGYFANAPLNVFGTLTLKF